MSLTAADVCALAPVIPVLIIDDAAVAAPLARALSRGGLKALEVTLRTPAALDAIRAMVDAAPDAVVGAGTLLTPQDVRAAKQAGARFGVSPGCTERLLDAAEEAGLPMLPGVATPGVAVAERDVVGRRGGRKGYAQQHEKCCQRHADRTAEPGHEGRVNRMSSTDTPVETKFSQLPHRSRKAHPSLACSRPEPARHRVP